MLKYKYSLYWDVIWAYRTIKNRKWLKEKGLVFFMPNIFRTMKILWNLPKKLPKIDVEKNIECFWITSGTWGSYTPPNKIFICPFKIPNLQRVIEHEITHLTFSDIDIKLNHEDKEKIINERQKEIFNKTP